MRQFLATLGRIISIAFTLILVLACVGPIIASAVLLEHDGIDTTAIVVNKSETIDRPGSRSTNDWTRRLRITVSYVPFDQVEPTTGQIPVTEATFDRLTVGSTVDIRYQRIPWMRIFPIYGVRLSDQTPLLIFTTFANNRWLPFVLGGIALGLAVATVRSRVLVLRVAFGTALVACIAAIVVVSIRPAALFEPGPHATATAQVLEVKRITEEPGYQRYTGDTLIQPIDRVQLQFVPQDMTDAVVAVDDIDAGSMAGLREGQSVTVSYPLARPRDAHIVGATHDHRYLNWLLIPRYLALVAVMLTAFLLIIRVLNGIVRRRLRHSLS